MDTPHPSSPLLQPPLPHRPELAATARPPLTAPHCQPRPGLSQCLFAPPTQSHPHPAHVRHLFLARFPCVVRRRYMEVSRVRRLRIRLAPRTALGASELAAVGHRRVRGTMWRGNCEIRPFRRASACWRRRALGGGHGRNTARGAGQPPTNTPSLTGMWEGGRRTSGGGGGERTCGMFLVTNLLSERQRRGRCGASDHGVILVKRVSTLCVPGGARGQVDEL